MDGIVGTHLHGNLRGKTHPFNININSTLYDEIVCDILTAKRMGDSDVEQTWLSSRGGLFDAGYQEYFTMYQMNTYGVSAGCVMSIRGNFTAPSLRLRPVVEVDLNNVHIGITGTGTSDSPYSISAR